ncbi:hypothetical protein D9757_000190 [Collybiopsis confluens]|uniref:Asl1-like glycosyl hydrolase catalytic domain-containing protein n=1 Tax=Collybiopsis confluens TaxID=2823264 RepID=A0A8H5I252_9AGAR|nr:hypothetical protein D9757_000190 [Collybiopsis confluens]
MAHKLLNLLALSSLAIMACSFGAQPVNALSATSPHSARDALRGHDSLAKRKRAANDKAKRCKARPVPSASDSASSSADATLAAAPTSSPSSSSSSSSSSSANGSSNDGSSGAASSPVSSPAPSSTPASASGDGSGKGCLAWPNGNSDLEHYKTDKTSTIYSWSESGPSNAAEIGFTFAPQLWGWKNADAFGKVVVAGYSNVALFVNEPNEAGQANMSPQDAVGLWNQYMEPLRSQGYRLGSAATSSNPNGMVWMNEFFAACNGGCKPDFMAVHWYDISADSFKSYVEQWHTAFNLPIWVTEFAYQDFNGNNQGDLSQIQSFMGDVTGWMDQQSYVEKYCWFGAMHDLVNVNPLNSLMNSDGTPTNLGYQFLYSG